MGKKTTPKRALIVARLSRVTEATTSPERQIEKCREVCTERGYEVVDVAYDPDVSAGATTPFERPKLGPWLRDRHHEYDVLVVYRMDRLVRRLLDLSDMIRWAQDHKVAIVSATEAFLDLDAPFGDITALLIAKVAEMELEAISARNASASHHNIRSGKWRGGVPPWGYLPQKDDAGVWRLVQDAEQVAVINEVVERVLAGTPLRAIAHDLTERKILTPKDRFSQVRGREVKGYEWHSGPLKRGLTSRTLLGQVVTRDPVLDEDGNVQRSARGQRVLGPEFVVTDDAGRPVVRAEPILSRTMFDRVGKELEGRENRKEPTKRSSTLLVGVIRCGRCGRAAYRLKGGKGRKPRYRCGSAQYTKQCDNRTLDLTWADEQVEQSILDRLGPMERMRRIWFAGNDSNRDLAEVNDVLADLTEQLGTGAFKRGTPQRARLDARISALVERQEALAAAPAERAGWVYEGTGETVAQWWAAANLEERNIWLRSTGVTVTWTSHTEGGKLQEAGKVVGGRTVLDDFVIDVGEPDLDAGVLPGAIAAMATAKAAGGWGEAVPEALAKMYWEHGESDHAGASVAE